MDVNGDDTTATLKKLFRHWIRRDFRDIADDFCDRLVSTMLLRRRHILYRRSRQAKRAVLIPKPAPVPTQPALLAPSAIGSLTIPKGMAHGTKAPTVPIPAPSGHAPTQYTATTVEPETYRRMVSTPSRVSQARTIPLASGGKEAIPLPPRVAANTLEFTCPFCCLILPASIANDRDAWATHVKKDLDPYVCAFFPCAHGEELFRTSSEWISHEQETHCMRWYCTAKAHKSDALSSEEEFIEHMKVKHPEKFKEAQLPFLSNSSRRPLKRIFDSCPLCGEEAVEGENLEGHVAHHLQYLALLSLPLPDDAENLENESESLSSDSRSEDEVAAVSRTTLKSESHLLPPATCLDDDEDRLDIAPTVDDAIPDLGEPLLHTTAQSWQTIRMRKLGLRNADQLITEEEQRKDRVLAGFILRFEGTHMQEKQGVIGRTRVKSGAGDFAAITQLAKQLGVVFRNAPKQFHDISTELTNLEYAFRYIDVFISGDDLNDAQKTELASLRKSCLGDLDTCRELLFESQPQANGLRAWKAVTVEPDSVRDLRKRITSNITRLNHLSKYSAIGSKLDKASSRPLSVLDIDHEQQTVQENSFDSLSVSNRLHIWTHDHDRLRLETGCEYDEVFQSPPRNIGAVKVAPVLMEVEDMDTPGKTWRYLQAPHAIHMDVPLIELHGRVGIQKDYCEDPGNRWAELSTPLPFVFFHPSLPLYIDTRKEGSIARFVRRSCSPNTALNTYLANGSIYHFWLVSSRKIAPNEQIMLPWDFRLPKPDSVRLLRLLGSSQDDTPQPEFDPNDVQYYQDVASWLDQVFAMCGPCACDLGAECRFPRFHRTYIAPIRKQEITDWLTPVDYAAQQSDFIRRRHPGTGQWFLDSPEYQKWLMSKKGTLFCPGMPGAGKTILSSIVVEHLQNTWQEDSSVGICYIFCNFNRGEEQDFHGLIASLLGQLVQSQSPTPGFVEELYNLHKERRSRPSTDGLCQALRSATAPYSRIFIVVDGLDELTSSTRSQFISELRKLEAVLGANILVTSRATPDIAAMFSKTTCIEIRASEKDISTYVTRSVSQFPDFVSGNPKLLVEIKESIINSAGGMLVTLLLYSFSYNQIMMNPGSSVSEFWDFLFFALQGFLYPVEEDIVLMCSQVPTCGTIPRIPKRQGHGEGCACRPR
ncbi:hypothetical protein PG984_008247 [Apiospora sp. TS-2023a]